MRRAFVPSRRVHCGVDRSEENHCTLTWPNAAKLAADRASKSAFSSRNFSALATGATRSPGAGGVGTEFASGRGVGAVMTSGVNLASPNKRGDVYLSIA